MEKRKTEFLTSVYRKPTFIGKYIRWGTFGPKSRKINLIGTLVHRALIICSHSTLFHKLNSICSILSLNGYPDRVIDLGIQKKLRKFKLLPKESPQKCLVYLKLPWISNISLKFKEQCKNAISMLCGEVKPCVIFSTKKMLPAIRKDAEPTIQKSMDVHQYVCRCDCRCVGCTSQRLQGRIKQYVLKSIRSKLQPERLSIKRHCKSASQLSPASYSAIGQHLLEKKTAQFTMMTSNFQHWLMEDRSFIFPL